jgi:cobalt-zinc-cadmium efflux system membrane fusion protein
LAIPAQAVIFDKNRHFVMVFKAKDKIDTRPVEIYRNVGGLAYIQSGLEEGEQVIVEQQLLIYDALND